MDTLRALAGDVSEFLTNRTDMVRNTPLLPPAWQGLRDKVASGEITTRDYLAALRSDPTIQREMFDTALNNPFFGPLVSGIKAFHGSPHDFDKFDLSRTGASTGMAAYGPGIYAATGEANAAGYRRGISAKNAAPGEIRERMIAAASKAGIDPRATSQVVQNVLSDIMEAGSPASYLRRYEFPPGKFGAAYSAAAEEAKKIGVTTKGKMYELDINAAPDELLDWNKPVGGQSDMVRQRLDAAGIGPNDGEYLRPRTMAEVEAIRSAGIPAMRYVGEGATDAAPNFVVFDDSLINILRKYGILAPLFGAGAGAAPGDAPEATQ
jgi:hypothetical protein